MKPLRRPGLALAFLVVLLVLAAFWFGPRRGSVPTPRPTAAQPALPPAPAPSLPLLSAAAPLQLPTPNPPVPTPPAVPTPPPVPGAGVFDAFTAWANRYGAAASALDKTALLAEGESLAQARHAEMVKLVRSDPQRALARALPYSLRKRLPPSLAPYLEQPVDARGALEVIHSVPLPEFKHVHLPTLYRVTVNQVEYEAFTYGQRQRAPRRTGLPIHGIAVADAKGKKLMALSDRPMRRLEEAEARDRLAAAGPGRAGRCGLCAKPTPPSAVHADCGGEILDFCNTAEFERASQLFTQMEDASAAPKVYAASAPAALAPPPDRLPPPTPGPHISAQKLLLIPVQMAYDPIPVTTPEELWRAAEYNNRFYVENSYGIMSWITTVTPTVHVPERRLYYAEAPELIYSDAIPRVIAMGYNPADYFMTYVVFNSLAPSVTFGGRSDGLFNGGPWAIDHELGHNLGVIHANYLNLSGTVPGPPYPPPNPPAAPYPVDIESNIGHDDVNAPVVMDDAMEVYGDPYDRMGGGGSHFNVYFKNLFDWLPANFIRYVSRSATNRLYAFDTPSITDGRAYGIRVPKNPGHAGTAYWLSYRQAFPDNPWMENGLHVLWESGGNTLLMDTTPLSFLGKYDGSIVVGRTFHDPEIQAHITPLAKGSDSPSPSDKWLDVVINFGTFPENVPPSFTLTSSPPIEAGQIVIPLGGSVTFGSQAQDPDGDVLAYYWEFGDLTVSGSNAPVVTKTYTTAGRFALRHEVSDLRGGVRSRNLIVVVGDAATFTISGHVTDELGNPVPNAVVHNCGSRPKEPEFSEGGAAGGGIPDFTAGTFRSGLTDSDGYYIIGNVSPGVYTNRAFRFGYITTPLFTDPVRVTSGDVIGLDHLANSLPHVSIEPVNDAVEGPAPVAGAYLARRTGGDLSVDLPVIYQVGGTAMGGDFTLETHREGEFVIPAWSDSVVFNLNPTDNSDATGPKSVTVSLLLQPTNIVIGSYTTNVVSTNQGVVVTNTVFLYVTNTYDIPGWQTNWVGATESRIYWFQTYPTYVLDAAQATVNILDDEPIGKPTVVWFVPDANASESREDTAVVGILRYAGDRTQPLTVRYRVSGTAVNGQDIYRLPGVITIPANEDYVLFPVKAINDLFVEGNEDLTLTLESDPAYVGSGSANLTIVDDDLPQVYVYASDSVADKTGNRGRVTIARSGDLRAPLLVNYLVSGTATNTDYQPLPGSVTIPAGQITATVDIIPVTNSPSVGARTVVIRLSDSTTYNIDAHNTATVTIEDRLPVVTVSPRTGTVAEGATVTLTFTRTGDTSNSLLVLFEVGGTAIENFDFAGLGTNVLIPAGSATKTITINAPDDAYREMGDVTGNDMLQIQIVDGPDYTLGEASSVEITITDNDSSALPGIGFMLPVSTVREDAGMATVAVRVTANPSGDPAKPVYVDCIISGGTAVPNVNYTPIPGGTNRLLFVHYDPPPASMFIFPQDGIQEVMVPIIQDGVVTTNKTIQLRLLNPNGWLTNIVNVTNTNTQVVVSSTNLTRIPTNAFLAPYTLHTITILDVDQNVVSVTTDTDRAYEAGPRGANFIITREGATDKPLTVHYAVADNAGPNYGAAAPGSDYVAFTTNNVGAITIPAGTNRVLIPLIPIDDPTEENAEPVAFELLERPGYQIGRARAQILIVSDDGTIQFTRATYAAFENATNAVAEVLRTGDTNLSISVQYRFLDGTAVNQEDYRGTNGTLVFQPGEVTKSLRVPLVNDLLVEPDETFVILLTNASGGVPLGGQREALVTILNDDVAFAFATNTFYVPENGTNAAIEIVRQGYATPEVNVRFATQSATATNGLDFIGTNLTVIFRAGETSRTVLIPLRDDVLFEGDETVLLRLSNPSANTLLGDPAIADLVIVDDECALGFSAATYTTNEFARTATLTVLRRGGTVNPAQIDFFSYDGTATNGTNGDYFSVSGTLNFRGDRWELSTNGDGTLLFFPGDAALAIEVPLIDDYVGEGNETFSVVLTNLVRAPNALPNSAILDTNRLAVVTLIDDESPGSVDYPYNAAAGPNGPVYAVALQPFQGERATVFAGEFTTVDGFVFNRVARWTPTGVLDPSFNPGFGANDTVHALAIDADGRVLLGGAFTSVDGLTRRRVARLNADGNIDTGFNPGAGVSNGTVRAIAAQADGKVVIGGDFTQVAGQARNAIARFNTDGALEAAFLAGANGAVHAVVIQPDQRILVAGAFSSVNGTPRAAIARLTGTGLLDSSFASVNFAGVIYSIALQTDGRIVVGGAFTTPGGTRRNLVRLNADGSLDSTFNPGAGPDGPVNAVGVHADGRILIGGGFTNYSGIPRNYYARLRPAGALDVVFNTGSGANAPVRALVVQADTATVIGGDFTLVNTLPRRHVARIHGDEKSNIIGLEFSTPGYRVAENAGSAPITFVRSGNTNLAFQIEFATSDGTALNGADYVGVTNTVRFAAGELSRTVTVQILDDLLVDGNETVNLTLRNGPANVEPSTSTAVLVIEDDEKSVRFTQARYYVLENATNAAIAVLREGSLAGTLSVTFNTEGGSASPGIDYGAVSNVLTFAEGESNKIVLIPIEYDDLPEIMETVTLRLSDAQGGTLVDPWLAKLVIQDTVIGIGAPDPTFDPGEGANSLVKALALMPTGHILVGGAFTIFDNTNRNYVTLLNVNGPQNPDFDPGTGPNAFVSGVAATADGLAVLGGVFTNVDGFHANRVGQLKPGGEVETLFSQPNKLNAGVATLALQPDGKIVVVGNFTQPAPGVSRLRVDGGVDVSFDPGSGANGPVHAVCLVTHGVAYREWPVVIGGAFTRVGATDCGRVARLRADGEVDTAFVPASISNGVVYAVAVDAEGKVLIGGAFTRVGSFARTNIARLNADGSVDAGFDPGTGANGTVYALAIQPNGKILLGGEFTLVNQTNRNRIARLLPDGSVDPDFDTSQGADSTVYSIVVLPDNKILIGGSFTSVSGILRRGVARLVGDPPPPMRVVSAQFAGGRWRVTINSRPDSVYTLEATTDWASWTVVNTATATGYVLELVDPTATPVAGWRFYRVGRLVQ